MEIILNTWGVNLNRDNEAFVVTSKDGRQRVPVDDVTSIQIARGASITSDAVMLAIENEISITFVARSGHPEGRVWSARYGSVSTIRKGQIKFAQGTEAVQWIKHVIATKIDNQQALLLMLTTTSQQQAPVQRACERLEGLPRQGASPAGRDGERRAQRLRGIEGSASRIYSTP